MASFDLTVHLRSATPPHELDSLFWSVSTPGSPRYLDFYKSAEALAHLFGAAPSSVDAATQWLSSLNGTQIRLSPMRDRLTAKFFSAPAGCFSSRGLPLRPPAGVHLVTRSDAGAPTSGGDPSPRARRRSSGYGVGEQKAAYQIPASLAVPLTASSW